MGKMQVKLYNSIMQCSIIVLMRTSYQLALSLAHDPSTAPGSAGPARSWELGTLKEERSDSVIII